MDSEEQASSNHRFNKQLATSGFRFTPQRQHVYNVLLQQRDHPTVEEVFIRSKEQMPDISMATVYNCLDALVKSGLVRHVNLERSATRFCPNMQEHCHFHCDDCSRVYDVEFASQGAGLAGLVIPSGFKVKQYDISIRGICRDCAAKQKEETLN
jgi:Fur family peroxide stress response transcriptional regulator